ncbi:MAG TPA: ECF transporter S component [Anaerolineales bacterium]|nr:ECF transporter S component [Anaerolineales bacterium]
MTNKWVRPILPIVIGFAALAILLYLGNAIASMRGGENAYGLGAQTALGIGGWITWLIIGAVIVYVVYVFFADQPIWNVGTREVVFMAIGAVLYGLLSWATNVSTIVVPSVSLVSLRPAVAIPPLFGFLFGPVVGFFAGAFGNILGDALTGWGVFPAWDLGNGLLGMIPGLLMVFATKKKQSATITWVVAALALIAAAFTLFAPGSTFENPITGEQANHSTFWWVLVLGAVVIVAAYFLFRQQTEINTAIVWSALGVIVGIGFASIADIWINGYTPVVAILGEFVPAVGPDIIFVAVLVPILLIAYRAAMVRGGR